MSLSAGARFDRLVAIMHMLRGPDGCPWDREQTLQSLRPFVIEETSELLDALDAGDMPAFKDELGDFLFEAVFLAELCAEAGHFTIADSVQSVIDKLIRRHPHVFTAGRRSAAEEHDDHRVRRQGAVGRHQEGGTGRRRPGPRRRRSAGFRDRCPHCSAPTSSRDARPRSASTGSAPPTSSTRSRKRSASCARPSPARGLSSDEAEEELGDLLFALANLAAQDGDRAGAGPPSRRTTSSRTASNTWSVPPEPMAYPAGPSFDDLDARWNGAKRHHEGTKDTK